jgi:tripartite-type tricarboxylate transporter receptor subunit TctC
MKVRRHWVILGVALVNGLAAAPLCAQEDYPNKAIKIILAWPSGRGVDTSTRQITARMSPLLGQSIVVENRPGASGIIGTEVASKAAPDGYTLYVGPITSVAMVPYLYSKLPFNMERDFIPVSQFSMTLVGMAAPPGLPAKTMKELVALSKMKPLNVATSGLGSNAHLYAAWFAMLTGANFNYVHYDTTHWGTDLMAGRVDAAFDGFPAYLGQYKGGKVKVLAVTGKQRSASFPDIASFVENGLGEFEPTAWSGLFAPAGVPQPIIERLAAAVAKAVKSPDLVEQYRAQGTEPVGNRPAEFGTFVRAEQTKWRNVIKAAGVRLD